MNKGGANSSCLIGGWDVCLTMFDLVIGWGDEGDILTINDINDLVVMGIDSPGGNGSSDNMSGNDAHTNVGERWYTCPI